MNALILSENLYSSSQFAQHVVSANAQVTGHEAFRVARASRSHLNYYDAGREGTFEWLKVDCGVPQPASMIALDRGHNLAGIIVRIQYSSDDFSADINSIQPANKTIPTSPGGGLDANDGALTEEGAWLLRFTEQTARYWRFAILGTGGGNPSIRPQIRGLWLGRWYDLGLLDRPWADEGAALIADEQETPYGWRAAATTTRRRTGTLNIRLDSFAAYDDARYHVQQRFHDEGRPSWVIHDDTQPERAVLARPIPGTLAFQFQRNWGYRRAAVQWVEHQPRFARGL